MEMFDLYEVYLFIQTVDNIQRKYFHDNIREQSQSELSDSHGGEFADDYLLGCCTM
jgi:hypothetical protein